MFHTLKRLFLQPSRRPSLPRRRVLRLESLEIRTTLTAGLDWAVTAQQHGTLGRERAEEIAIDTANNSYVAGTFSGTVDFDTQDSDPTTRPELVKVSYSIPNPSPEDPARRSYLPSGFVAKYNAAGQCEWVTAMTESLSGAVQSEAKALTFTYDATYGGRVVAVGHRSTSTTFGSAGQDGVVAWFDAATGAVLSTKMFGGTRDNDYGADVTIDSTGNVYVTGSVENAPASVFYNKDIYVAKFNANTSLAWAKMIGGSSYADEGTTIGIDGSGNVTVGGNFEGTVDFDPGSGTYSLQSGTPKLDHPRAGFVLQLNNSGAFRWADHFAVSQTFSHSSVTELVVDASGAVTVSGIFKGNVDLNPDKRAAYSVSSVNGVDGYLVRLNASGKFVWAKTMDTTFVSGMTVGGDGGIYVTGGYNPDSSDPGFIARLNSTTGDLDQVVPVASGGSAIAVDGAGNIWLVGSFSGTDVDFDFTDAERLLSAEGDQVGMFLMRLHL
ncbi:MAG: SBBP repeat-containing protein [Pirellulales bacterium]